MSKRTSTKLSSFFNSQQYTEELTKMEDILQMNITVKGVNWRKGPNGEYAVMDITIIETGAEIKASTGAMAICDALRTAATQRMFPFDCKVIQHNRMYLMVDPD